MADDVEWIKRYKISGWAIIHIDSKGFFGVVSDYGNYAYHWSDWGKRSFAHFLMELDSSYLLGKLCPQREYDPEMSLQKVKEAIKRQYPGRDPKAKTEMALLKTYDDLYRESDFILWSGKTTLDFEELRDCQETRANPHCVVFCTELYPKFIEQLKQDFP